MDYIFCNRIVFFRKEEEIEKMRVTAEKAMHVSLEAYNITRDAVNQQKNIRYNDVVFNNFVQFCQLSSVD